MDEMGITLGQEGDYVSGGDSGGEDGGGEDERTLNAGLFACVRASQHGYAAVTERLSLYDGLDIYEVGMPVRERIVVCAWMLASCHAPACLARCSARRLTATRQRRGHRYHPAKPSRHYRRNHTTMHRHAHRARGCWRAVIAS